MAFFENTKTCLFHFLAFEDWKKKLCLFVQLASGRRTRRRNFPPVLTELKLEVGNDRKLHVKCSPLYLHISPIRYSIFDYRCHLTRGPSFQKIKWLRTNRLGRALRFKKVYSILELSWVDCSGTFPIHSIVIHKLVDVKLTEMVVPTSRNTETPTEWIRNVKKRDSVGH